MKRIFILVAVLVVVFSVRFVMAQTCQADFIYDANCPTQFTDQSTPSTAGLFQWDWDFGDGNTSTAVNPIHTYAANGTYIVVLQISDSAGCNAGIAQTVSINCVPVELQSFSVE